MIRSLTSINNAYFNYNNIIINNYYCYYLFFYLESKISGDGVLKFGELTRRTIEDALMEEFVGLQEAREGSFDGPTPHLRGHQDVQPPLRLRRAVVVHLELLTNHRQLIGHEFLLKLGYCRFNNNDNGVG